MPSSARKKKLPRPHHYILASALSISPRSLDPRHLPSFPTRRSSDLVAVSVPSSAPSAPSAVFPCPTRSRSLPLYARLSVAADALVTVKPPVSVTLPPPGFVTVTSRAPAAAPAAMASVAVICPAPTATVRPGVPAPPPPVAPAADPRPPRAPARIDDTHVAPSRARSRGDGQRRRQLRRGHDGDVRHRDSRPCAHRRAGGEPRAREGHGHRCPCRALRRSDRGDRGHENAQRLSDAEPRLGHPA